ncbi:MAG TPA: tetratricopeptide repeat protein [Leptolyngbyaceae cyanobacterium]
MKMLKYTFLISLGLMLVGGVAAERANAQATNAPNNTAQTNTAPTNAAEEENAWDGAGALSPQDYIQQTLNAQFGLASQGQTAAPQTSTAARVAVPAPNVANESEYDRLMRLGYAESKVGNHPVALQYFEQALAVNPGDRMATIAYWNTVNAINTLNAQQTQPSNRAARISAATVSTGTGAAAEPTNYDQYMNAGYAAAEARDYATALNYFNSAQQLRPNDPYAIQAIRNVTTFMQVQGSQGAITQ